MQPSQQDIAKIIKRDVGSVFLNGTHEERKTQLSNLKKENKMKDNAYYESGCLESGCLESGCLEVKQEIDLGFLDERPDL